MMRSDEELLGAMSESRDNKIKRLEAENRALRAELETYKRDQRHVIEFREDGWTIQHPLSCRPNLFDCIVNTAAPELVMAPGRYYCDVSPSGRIMGFEPVK